MPEITVFISHSWNYTDHYDKLAKWLFRDKWKVGGIPLVIRDNSVPKDRPILGTQNDYELVIDIALLIQGANVIVVPTAMYATHSKWIGTELNIAQSQGKPILAVNPWGQERTSSVVQERATCTVGWNSESVVSSVWNLANS